MASLIWRRDTTDFPDLPPKSHTVSFCDPDRTVLTITLVNGKARMEGDIEAGSEAFAREMMSMLGQRTEAFSLLLDLARAVTAEEPLAEDYERHHLYTLARRALDAAEGKPSTP